MRKFYFILLPMLLFIASCKKTEIVNPNQTIVVNLSPGKWIPLNGGNSYTAAIDIHQLDDYINERGGVLVYISFGNKTYEQIPQVFYGEAYSYVTRPGQIVLEVQNSDGLGIVNQPAGMTVKVVLIESDF